MKFLIWTQPADLHSVAVERVLTAGDHQVDRLFTSDIPELASLSFTFDHEAEVAEWEDATRGPTRLDHDVVWLRRPADPVVEHEIDPRDVEVARAECEALVEGLWLSSTPSATWVNPNRSRLRASSKVSQIVSARRAGLLAPRTIVSNSPAEIRSFIGECPAGAVYKAFLPDRWGDGQRVLAKLRTMDVAVEDLPADRTLRLTPGIYQERLRADFEVRVTFFDDFVVAARLDTHGMTDARDVPLTDRNIRSIDMPDNVRASCLALMKEIDLRFATFDFIVQNGHWFFLEVNEMGQFFWIEVGCPEIPMLSIFSQFLANSPTGRPFRPVRDGVAFRDVVTIEEADRLIAQEVAMHRFHYAPPHPF